MRRRVLVIGLDGVELTYVERLIDEGRLPSLAALRARSVRAALDHGPAQRTGLAWEHFATGLSPSEARRWSAVTFGAADYSVRQDPTSLPPFFAHLHERSVVVVDVPYCDLRAAPQATGVVAWGAHDPGVATQFRPATLRAELEARFGSAGYPAAAWTYGCPWPSASQCRAMGVGLAGALERRGDIAEYLLRERLTDWDLAVVVAGEPHGAVEALWHGVDPDHPLHRHPSAPAAAAALLQVHEALDRLVGRLVELAGEAGADVVAVAMGGMGSNDSDVPSMVLLPELLHRAAGHDPLLVVPRAWRRRPERAPWLDDDETWTAASFSWHAGPAGRARRALRSLPLPVRRAVRAVRRHHVPTGDGSSEGVLSLDWHPATWYQPWWSSSEAFALPSFYDGRVRVNLEGREAHGTVPQDRYRATLERVIETVAACVDPATGRGVLRDVEWPADPDPMSRHASDADLTLLWAGAPLAFRHPELGLVGPLPYRRTGGHTGRYGMAWVAGEGIVAEDLGVRSSFDVVPTVLELLGGDGSKASGTSFAPLVLADRGGARR